MNDIKYVPCTVATGQTTSSATSVGSHNTRLVGIVIPAEFDGTAVSIHACDTNDGTFYAVDALTAMNASASTYLAIAPQDSAGLKWVKIVCGTAQTGATAFKLATANVL